MSGEIVPAQMTDMLDFTDAQIKKAGELLGCQMDRASCIRALIIQQDTGLSMARGEISIVPFKGKPQVFINRQGYLAYANRQTEYDGFESGTEEVNGRLTAWCKVYRKDRRFPASVRILYKEFGESKAKTSPVWQQMPEYMLEKTAISLSLRQAFPVLNGTLTEEEIDAPYTIARRPDDIDVIPTPAPERIENPKTTTEQETAQKEQPAKEGKITTEKSAPKVLYSQAQVKTVIQNMQSKGLEVPDPAFFDAAKLPDGMYNGDTINAEFTRLINLKKEEQTKKEQAPATKAPELFCCVFDEGELHKQEEQPKQTKPTPEPKKGEQTQTVCPICGKPSMTKEEANFLECAADTKIFEHTLCKDCATKWWKDRQAKQKELDERMPKCTDCGKRLTDDEARRSMAKFGEPVCPDCWIRRYNKKE